MLTSSPAQNSMFTYQGRLFDGGQAALGTYDLQFRLTDAATNGNYVGPALVRCPTSVTNGVFTVTLDFGSGIFDGSARFLEAGVRTNGSTADYTVLQPLQPITTAPYAMLANTAVAAGVASNLVAGAVLTNLTIAGSTILPGTINAAQIDPATDAAYRALDTNAVLALISQVVSASPQVSPTSPGTSSRWVDAKVTFGAKGDGVSDDTAALQAGLNYLASASASNMTLYIPPGTYLLSNTLVLPPSSFPHNPVLGMDLGWQITGAGMSATRLYWPAIGNGMGLALTNLVGHAGVSIQNLTLVGPLMGSWNSANTSIGLALGKFGADTGFSGWNNVVQNCGILGWGYGAAATNQWGLVFDNCLVGSNNFEGLRFAGSHDVSVQNCRITGGWNTACGIGVGFHPPLNYGYGDNAQVMNTFIANCTNGIFNQELNLLALNTHLESCGSYFTLVWIGDPNVSAPATTIVGGYILDWGVPWTNGFAGLMLMDGPSAQQTLIQNCWLNSDTHPWRALFNVTNQNNSPVMLPGYWGYGSLTGLWNTTSNVVVNSLGAGSSSSPLVTTPLLSSRLAAPSTFKPRPQLFLSGTPQ